MERQLVLILDSPDGCGKTEISKALAKEFGLPYFKATVEKENWDAGKFKEELQFGERRHVQLIQQLKLSLVQDRGYPSEFVYSQVFSRETDMDLLRRVDDAFATMGAIIIIPLRRDYSGNREDELVPADKLQAIHGKYLEFLTWTRCSTIIIFVDDFDNDLRLQMPHLVEAVDLVHHTKHPPFLPSRVAISKQTGVRRAFAGSVYYDERR